MNASMRHVVPGALLVVLVVGAASLVGCGDDATRRTMSDLAEPVDARGCVVAPDGVTRYRVQSGETLSWISQRVYGDAALWPEIARANPELVGDDGAVRADVLLVIPFAGR